MPRRTDLLRSLTAYAEHPTDCPWWHGRTFDENGRERPCTCGLNELLARVNEETARREARPEPAASRPLGHWLPRMYRDGFRRRRWMVEFRGVTRGADEVAAKLTAASIALLAAVMLVRTFVEMFAR